MTNKRVTRILNFDMIIAFLLCLFIIGSSLGFLISSRQLVNRFSVGENNSIIEETWVPPESFERGQSYTKDVRVKNLGSVPCYVRIFAEVEDPDVNDKLSINFNKDDWTEKQADGYYYFKQIVKSGESTSPLFTALTANDDINEFRMICYSESIQSDGFSSAVDAFSKM